MTSLAAKPPYKGDIGPPVQAGPAAQRFESGAHAAGNRVSQSRLGLGGLDGEQLCFCCPGGLCNGSVAI